MYVVDPSIGMNASSTAKPQTKIERLFSSMVTQLFGPLFRKESALGAVPSDTDADVLASQSELARRIAAARGRKSTIITGGLASNPTISRLGLMGVQ